MFTIDDGILSQPFHPLSPFKIDALAAYDNFLSRSLDLQIACGVQEHFAFAQFTVAALAILQAQRFTPVIEQHPLTAWREQCVATYRASIKSHIWRFGLSIQTTKYDALAGIFMSKQDQDRIAQIGKRHQAFLAARAHAHDRYPICFNVSIGRQGDAHAPQAFRIIDLRDHARCAHTAPRSYTR